MATTMRKIVRIDEAKCNGCGACVISCAEGALKIIDGKVRLVSDRYCDGLGDCLGKCPQDAITVEERPAEDFDEVAATLHKAREAERSTPCACPSSALREFAAAAASPEGASQPSLLRHWPVQLALVPPSAPFLKNANLVLAADCVGFAYPEFHRDFLTDHSLLVACPKLDDFEAHLARLTAILQQADIRSLTVVHMEVPCCSGLVYMVQQALEAAGRDIPLREVTVSIRCGIKAAV